MQAADGKFKGHAGQSGHERQKPVGVTSTTTENNGLVPTCSNTGGLHYRVCRNPRQPGWIYRVLSVPRKLLASFLDFFAAFFSFGVMAGFFLVSLLLFCSLDMVSLRIKGG